MTNTFGGCIITNLVILKIRSIIQDIALQNTIPNDNKIVENCYDGLANSITKKLSFTLLSCIVNCNKYIIILDMNSR